MLNFYKSLRPAALALIPFFALLLWLPGFFKEIFIASNHTGFVDQSLLKVVSFLPKFFQVLLAVLLVSAEAVYLTVVINRHEALEKNTYLPALFFVLLMSFSGDVVLFHQNIIVNFLLIFACDKIFSLFKNDWPVALIFDCGLLLSVASLIYFPCVILFFFFLIVLRILRPANLREWGIAFVAFALPYFFLAVYAFLTDSLGKRLEGMTEHCKIGKEIVQAGSNLPSFHFSVLPFVAFLLCLLLLSLVRLRANFYKNSIKTRSVHEALVILSTFIFVEILFLKKIELYHFTQLAVPCSVFLAYFYITAQKRLWVYETSFWILVALIVQSYW